MNQFLKSFVIHQAGSVASAFRLGQDHVPGGASFGPLYPVGSAEYLSRTDQQPQRWVIGLGGASIGHFEPYPDPTTAPTRPGASASPDALGDHLARGGTVVFHGEYNIRAELV